MNYILRLDICLFVGYCFILQIKGTQRTLLEQLSTLTAQ